MAGKPWEKYQSQGGKPWEKYETANPTTPIGESMVRGGAMGLLGGFSDELQAAGRAGLQTAIGGKKLGDIVDTYRTEREAVRAAEKKAAEDNPASYYGSEVVGGIAPSLIPGVGAANIFRAGGMGKALLQGGIMGLGTSEADLTKGQVKDAALDAGVGAGVNGVLHGVVETAKMINPRNAAVKAGKVLFGTPEEVTNTYINNPEAVRNAPTRFELSKKWGDTLDALSKEATEGSNASRAILEKEGTTFTGDEIASKIRPLADALEKRSEGVWDDPKKEAAFNYLKSLEAKYSANPDQKFSGNKVKDLIQTAQRATDYSHAPGQISPIDNQTTKALAANLREYLQSKSPAFTEEMKQTAADTNLLNRAQEVGGEKSLPNMFRRLENDKFGAGQAPRETIRQLDERMGTNFLETSPQAMAKELFEKSVTNGSRNTQMASNTLKDVPILKYLAPLLGGTIDKYGNKFTQSAVDAAAGIERFMQNPNVMGANIKSFTDAGRTLLDKAAQGDPSSRLTLYLLDKKHPGFIQNLEKALHRSFGNEQSQYNYNP